MEQEEKLRLAAEDYAGERMGKNDNTWLTRKYAFIHGADWRINNAWHPNTEMPNRNLDEYYCGEACLVQALDGKVSFGVVHYGYGYNGKMFYNIVCMDKTYTMDEIKLWAYVIDLTPNRNN